jgi:hypothetical protein
LPDQASFPQKFIFSEDCDNGFIALLGYDGNFDLARLDIDDRFCRIALLEDNDLLFMRGNSPADAGGL